MRESAVMSDPERAIDALGRLRQYGVGLSIDDFGTGYSSLAYVKRLPVTEIKVDRSFVRDVATDTGDASIVRAWLRLPAIASLPWWPKAWRTATPTSACKTSMRDGTGLFYCQADAGRGLHGLAGRRHLAAASVQRNRRLLIRPNEVRSFIRDCPLGDLWWRAV